MIQSVVRQRIAKGSFVYGSPSEQLPSFLFWEVATCLWAKISLVIQMVPHGIWNRSHYECRGPLAHLFTHHQWALWVIVKHTVAWDFPKMELLLPKKVLADTEDLSGEHTGAVKALTYPKTEINMDSGPIHCSVYTTYSVSVHLTGRICAIINLGLRTHADMGRWFNLSHTCPCRLWDYNLSLMPLWDSYFIKKMCQHFNNTYLHSC